MSARASTYVIAEAGSCHDGNLSKARELVLVAARAGADAVKFQYWSSHNRLADRRRVPDHYRDIYWRYMLPVSWLPVLAAEAEAQGIDFMCTAYLPEDVSVVEPFVRHFKVASFEAEARDLLEAHRPFLQDGRRWLVVSLGMGADPPDFDPGWEHKLGVSPLRVQVMRYLHCVSAYPAPLEALCLRRITEEQLHGLSDHTSPWKTATGGLAVAAGAQIIEAHLRLVDTNPKNPDAPHAMPPGVFEIYVRRVREAERAMGDGRETAGPHPCEEEMALYRVTGR